MTNCLRCEKVLSDDPVSCHTCTPNGTWRKGMDEGIQYMIDNIQARMKTIDIFSGEELHVGLMNKWLEELKQGKSHE